MVPGESRNTMDTKGGTLQLKTKQQTKFCLAAALLAAFAVWTAAVRFVDIRTIGPEGSAVGFASLNGFIHRLTGVRMSLYTVTDWLGLIPLGIIFAFAVLGLMQWIRRKSLRSVDPDILLLGGFYLIVMTFYVFFEIFAVNFRPVLIEGILEVSYPSSTTMLALCVMPTAAMQFRRRIQNRVFRRWLVISITLFTAFMVIGRLLSGVHWFSDIVGGILLSAGLDLLYSAVSGLD
jgi:undecaprenyl-diphosphatase